MFSDSMSTSSISMPDNFADLLDLVLTVVRKDMKNWGHEFDLFPNPHLDADSRLYKAWLSGSRLLNSTSASTTIQVGYHGTYNENNVDSIMRNGFDPSKRRTQGYGPGEYFGTRPETSKIHSAGTNMIIATVIISSPLTKVVKYQHPPVIVVNNPPTSEATMCLPLVLISWNPSPKSESIQLKPIQPHLNAGLMQKQEIELAEVA
jgi:hypothetical protein